MLAHRSVKQMSKRVKQTSKSVKHKSTKKSKRTRKDKDTKIATLFTMDTMVNAVTKRPFLLHFNLPEHEKNKYSIFPTESYVQILIFNTPDSRNLKKHYFLMFFDADFLMFF